MTLQPVIALSLAAVVLGACKKRMHPDQQIYFIEMCEQARREALAASEAEREQAITGWVLAVDRGGGLCTNDLHDALVLRDEPSHALALEVLTRTRWRAHLPAFESDLASDRLTPEQRQRVLRSLRTLSGKDFGEDRTAWEVWLRENSAP
jgi:hypothetical protein